MFKYIKLQEALVTERQKSEQLRAEMAKKASDLDYLAMMCDVDLDEEADEDEQ